MISSLTRDEILVGAYLTGTVDQLTKLALNRFGISNSNFVRGVTICAFNITVLYTTGSVSTSLPGIFYGIGVQIKDAFNEISEDDALENKIWVTNSNEYDKDIPDIPTFTQMYNDAMKAKTN